MREIQTHFSYLSDISDKSAEITELDKELRELKSQYSEGRKDPNYKKKAGPKIDKRRELSMIQTLYRNELRAVEERRKGRKRFR